MDYERPRLRWYTHLADFANTLKAFIGSNYLTIAFAFKQSGLVMGVIGLLFIATLTDHCCHLLVKSKYFAIKTAISRSEAQDESSSSPSQSEDQSDDTPLLIENETFHSLTYGDIANIAFGKIGLYVVNACIFFTQYGFCVAYFIFIGNTLFNLFPYKTCHVTFSNASVSQECILNDFSLNVHPVMAVVNHSYAYNNLPYNTKDSTQLPYKYVSSSGSSNSELVSIIMSESLLNNSTTLPTTATTATTALTSTVAAVNWTHFNNTVLMTTAPSKKYLVLVPLPIFILFAYIRHMRHLGIVSATANISILIGCVSVLIYLFVDFSVSSHYELFDLRHSLIFFGLVSSSFEGIGCVIPIESSMKGNRHNFPLFLHGAVIFLSFMLLVFGILGYLRFGQHVAQMININIPPGSLVSLVVNICLCVGVVLTFPLQLFPVIQMAELYIFGDGRLCGPKKRMLQQSNRHYEATDSDAEQTDGQINGTAEDYQVLIPNGSTDAANSTPGTISDKVAAWKRNILRTFIVLSAAGFAVLFRNSFAYLNGFVGSIGSTTLAYIMPSLIHTKLGGTDLKRPIRLKNYMIVVVGVVCGVASLCATIIELVNNTSV
ncbi:uncharacterized protein LOC121379778 [Gigantopelta aegis]|uniref:uncharacterized protein LOC121379778 n=1 Tax=Gigantopelta aegis TaxID=1735272 RepID=UPI001B88E1FA|nr:uncharacterized protein LOC121379778 [Gigantopelta aegis]